MISRVWRGWTTRENADAYESLLRTSIFPGIEQRRIDGYQGISLYRRADGDRVEFVTTMLFDSEDAVRAFAGPDHETAVVPPAARNVLADFEPRSAHYDVVEARTRGVRSVIARTANALERCAHGPMWHGPSLLEAVDGVTAEQAAAHPIAGAHSIWELVLHITTWPIAARERLAGGPGERTAEENFPTVTSPDAASWKAAVAAMASAYDDLATAVRASSEDALLAMLPGRDHTALTMLHGVIEHGTDHGGQIAILRRAQGVAPASS
jgi:uncharacterized damage-inducible protein DinB/heme-degrading monooxygenase HmoA